MGEEDEASYAKLCKFIDVFYPAQWVTMEGKDFLDDDEPVFKAQAISTKALLECHSYEECVTLLFIFLRFFRLTLALLVWSRVFY